MQVTYKKATTVPEDKLVECLGNKLEAKVASAEFLCDVSWPIRHLMEWSALSEAC